MMARHGHKMLRQAVTAGARETRRQPAVFALLTAGSGMTAGSVGSLEARQSGRGRRVSGVKNGGFVTDAPSPQVTEIPRLTAG
jgi:hypothetical protein